MPRGARERRRLREVERGLRRRRRRRGARHHDRRAAEATDLRDVVERDPDRGRASSFGEKSRASSPSSSVPLISSGGRPFRVRRPTRSWLSAPLHHAADVRVRPQSAHDLRGRADRARAGGPTAATARRRSSRAVQAPGGPDGGDGGRGGDVVFEVATGVRDLAWLADHPHLRGESGGSGGKRGKSGAAGEDLVIRVPTGRGSRTSTACWPISSARGRGRWSRAAGGGSRERLARHLARSRADGCRGRRARGGEAARRRAPHRRRRRTRRAAERRQVDAARLPDGGAPEDRRLSLHDARAEPRRGGRGRAVRRRRRPRALEGAHEGKGLGHRFLRHVSRCRALVLVVDLSAPIPRPILGSSGKSSARTTRRSHPGRPRRRHEARSRARRRRAGDPRQPARSRSRRSRARGWTPCGDGSPRLRRGGRGGGGARPYVVLRPARPRFVVKKEGERFRVIGRGVERWVTETDLEDPEKLLTPPTASGERGGRTRARLGGRPAWRRGHDRRRRVRVPPEEGERDGSA